jgi:hypothetical protein
MTDCRWHGQGCDLSRPDPDMPYTVVLTIPMPSRESAEDLATAYRLEWAECPEVGVGVREPSAALLSKRKED